MGNTLSGRYILERRLAIGGMAEIFLARVAGAEGFEKRVVIKRMLPSHAEREDSEQMFLDEARLAGRFNHPNLCQVYELARLDGQYCLAMEYLEGEDLDEVLNTCERRERFPEVEDAAYIIAEVADALHYAHTLQAEDGSPLNVVHRDVSPANIIVTYHGEVKLVDFGIAKHEAASTQTQAGIIKGKYSYMSPEQILGHHLDQRSDLFALGAVLYEILALVRCFSKPTPMEAFQAITKGKYPPITEFRDDIPAELTAIIDKMLAHRRNDRYPDASAVARDLRSFLRGRRQTRAMELRLFMRELFEETGLHNSVVYTGVGAKPIKVGGELASANVTVSAETYRKIFEDSRADSDTEALTRPIAQQDQTMLVVQTGDILGPSEQTQRVSLERDEPTMRVDSQLLDSRETVVATPKAMRSSNPAFMAQDWSATDVIPPDVVAANRSLGDRRGAVVPDSSSFRGEQTHTTDPDGFPVERSPIGRLWVIGLLVALAVATSGLVVSQLTQPSRAPALPTETEPPSAVSVIRELPPTPRMAFIHLNSYPQGAAIFLDGVDTGQETPADLTVPGGPEYELTGKLEGYEIAPLRISPSPGDSTSVILQLRSSPETAAASASAVDSTRARRRPSIDARSSAMRTAKLIITSDPPATLVLDGKRLGQTPIELTVESGTHILRAFDKQLGFNRVVSLRVRAGQTMRKNLFFAKGEVVIASDPWAHVYLGERKLGTTPMVTELYEGTHTLKLTNPDQGKTRQVRVLVRAGQKSKVSEKL